MYVDLQFHCIIFLLFYYLTKYNEIFKVDLE